MKENEFLKKLQQRAVEQEQVMNNMPFPRIFAGVTMWLGTHPWRILIPLAFLLTVIFHFALGKPYDNLILRIFGGFGIIKLGLE